MIESLEKRERTEGVEEGGQEEGQVNAAVADDGAGEGDHDPDDEHTAEGEDEAKPAKGGEDGVLREAAEVAAVQEVMDEGEANDAPDREEFDGEQPIKGAATGSRKRFKETV